MMGRKEHKQNRRTTTKRKTYLRRTRVRLKVRKTVTKSFVWSVRGTKTWKLLKKWKGKGLKRLKRDVG